MINLPAQIKSGSTVKANYSYLSDGTKTKALNASSVGYDYAGSFTYSHASNGTKTLESVAFSGGRIRWTGNNAYAVDYHITDHLGSVRAIVNASGTVVEQNDYYPFGMRHPNGLTQLAANRWRFSGKEEQDAAFGIGYSDFGARFYDRSAAWTAVDPLAEKYYTVSPYAYCNNNPVKFVDPQGDTIKFASGVSDSFKQQYFQTVQFMKQNGTSGNIELLEKSTKVYYLTESVSINAHFDPNTKEISWNPNYISQSDLGIMSSPATILSHEVDHAQLFDSNFDEFKRNANSPDSQFGNKEDRRAIQNEQQTARKQLELFGNQMTRDQHSKAKAIHVGNASPQRINQIVQENNYFLWITENLY